MTAPDLLADEPERRWVEAVEWHARRCECQTLTAAQASAWRAWIQDPQNQKIYAACARLYAQAQQLNSATAAVPRQDRSRSALPKRGSLIPWRIAFLHTVIAATVLGWGVLCWRFARDADPVGDRIPPVPMVPYRTRAGQTRQIRLTDGSTVIMGADTGLSVAFGAQQRTIFLTRGEAWFRVVHWRDRPFVVRAGNGIITDLGTAFVVNREQRRVEVTVTEGRIEIAVVPRRPMSLIDAPSLEPIRLHRGERFSYGADARESLRTVDPRIATGWTHGELEFSDEPLRYVIENLNRYTVRPILVSRAAGSMRLTTLIRAQDIPAWLNSLKNVLPIEIDSTAVSVCIRLRVYKKTSVYNDCHSR